MISCPCNWFPFLPSVCHQLSWVLWARESVCKSRYAVPTASQHIGETELEVYLLKRTVSGQAEMFS